MDEKQMSQRLETMSTNVQDILQSVGSIHGERYRNTLLFLFSIGGNITQLDDMLCESTALIRNQAAADNNESLLAAATMKHAAGHDISIAAIMAVNALISLLETEMGMKDLSRNFASLLHRIEVDFRNPHG